MKKVINSLNTVSKGLKPLAVDFYSKTAWLCEIVYKSSDPAQADIRIVTNVILRTKKKKDKEVDEIFIRDPSVQMELWPRNIGLKLMKAHKMELDDLSIAK